MLYISIEAKMKNAKTMLLVQKVINQQETVLPSQLFSRNERQVACKRSAHSSNEVKLQDQLSLTPALK